MIEHLFCLVKADHGLAAVRPRPEVPSDHGPNIRRNRDPFDETQSTDPASTPHMKRVTASPVATTLRTGFMVGLALILILVLLPAAMAQASGPR
jgi:hypothetical protein